MARAMGYGLAALRALEIGHYFAYVPEGRSTVARRFNAGLQDKPSKSRRDG